MKYEKTHKDQEFATNLDQGGPGGWRRENNFFCSTNAKVDPCAIYPALLWLLAACPPPGPECTAPFETKSPCSVDFLLQLMHPEGPDYAAYAATRLPDPALGRSRCKGGAIQLSYSTPRELTSCGPGNNNAHVGGFWDSHYLRIRETPCSVISIMQGSCGC